MSHSSRLNKFYSEIGIADWQAVLGEELHYHFGHFTSKEMTFEDGLREAIRKFYGEIPMGSRVLDIGCGWGGPARLLMAERSCQIKGITISSRQQSYCSSLGLDVAHGDLETMPIDFGQFDVAIIIECLEHIRQKEQLFRKLRECCSTLILNVNCLKNLVDVVQGHGWGYMYIEMPELLEKQLERAGWKIKSIENRRGQANRTQQFWLDRIMSAYPDREPPDQISKLKTLSANSLADLDTWTDANLLLDIVAE